MLARMSEHDAGTKSAAVDAEIEISLGMIRAGVEAFYRWNGEEEEPEALVWAICEAVIAARSSQPSPPGASSQTLLESRPQGVRYLVTVSERSPPRAVLLERDRQSPQGQF